MDNLRFVDEEEIPLAQDEDYDNYGTPNTSRVDETSFMETNTTEGTATLRLGQKVKQEGTATLRLGQKVKQDKHTALYRHLNVTDNIGLIDLGRFRVTTNPKKGATIFEFCNGDKWVPLTKQTEEKR